MNNWINPDTTANQFNFTTGATDNLTFTTDTNDTLNFPWSFDPMLEWLPEASKWKKYFPSWHLVRSYDA